MTPPKILLGVLGALAVTLLVAAPAHAGEWPAWRGPAQDGNSLETGLVSTWSKDGQNLVWRVPLTGRSTPLVFYGRACLNGRRSTPRVPAAAARPRYARSGRRGRRRRAA